MERISIDFEHAICGAKISCCFHKTYLAAFPSEINRQEVETLTHTHNLMKKRKTTNVEIKHDENVQTIAKIVHDNVVCMARYSIVDMRNKGQPVSRAVRTYYIARSLMKKLIL